MAIYLFSVQTFVFCFFLFCCSSFDKKGGIGLCFIIGVPLLHLIPPEVILSKAAVQSQSHIATDSQSVSLGVEPHLGFKTRYLLLFDSYGLIFVGRPL
jgi:hypothetical protein